MRSSDGELDRSSEAATREPIPTPDELVARAATLRPYLRERQAETEERGRPSKETHDKLVAAGFYKIYIPRKHGGNSGPARGPGTVKAPIE